MLIDIVIEALTNMDDATLDSVLESCDAEELEIISDAMESANSDMRNVTTSVCGRKFKLDVIFDKFDNEDVLPEQKAAANKFLRRNFILKSKEDTEHVKNYIKSASDGQISEVDNIFKYIMPKDIYIPRNKQGQVAIMCDSKFDPEHGISIIYENNKIKDIVQQDAVL